MDSSILPLDAQTTDTSVAPTSASLSSAVAMDLGLPTSNIRRVLDTPELLQLILEPLEKRTVTRCARVCKTWTGVALDVLWREMYTLVPLLQILAPMTTVEKTLVFSCPLRSDLWTKTGFTPYARRVKYLVVHSRYDATPLHESIFAELARTCPTRALLPNLQSLVLAEPPSPFVRYLPMFLQSVRRLEFIPGKDMGADAMADCFADILSCSPLVEKLDIGSGMYSHPPENEVIQLLSSLKSLRDVGFSSSLASSEVMCALSKLPALETIRHAYARPSQPKGVFNPPLETGSFPSLKRLSLCCNISAVTQFFSMPHAPANVTMLIIKTSMLTSPQTFTKAMFALASCCKLLTNLCIEILPDIDDDILISASVAKKELSFKELKFVFQLPHLINFELVHPRSLALTDYDMDELSRNWPKVEGLILNPCPVSVNTQLTIASLASLSYHCPNLTKLGLQVDFTKWPTSSAPDHPYNLPRLVAMGFGSSPIDGLNCDGVCLFLSTMCGSRCILSSKILWIDEVHGLPKMDQELHRQLVSYQKIWDSIANVFNLLIRVRERGRWMKVNTPQNLLGAPDLS